MVKRIARPYVAAARAAPLGKRQWISEWWLAARWAGPGLGPGAALAAPRPPAAASDVGLLAAEPGPDSFRAVVAHLLLVGHFIGALPASASRETVPSFRWASPLALVSYLVAAGVSCRILVYLYCVHLGYMSMFDTVVGTRMGFAVASLLELVLFVRLASRWRSFLLCFLRVEGPRAEGGLAAAPRTGLRRRLHALTALIASMAIGDLLLQVLTIPMPQSPGGPARETLEVYYTTVFNNVAQAIPYSPAALAASLLTTAATNFVLTYNDIFLILVSVVIYRRFRALSEHLARAAPQQERNDLFWRRGRESFNDLSQLTRNVDGFLSGLVLLSCLNNFFSICIQLKHSVRPAEENDVTLLRKLYFSYSFLLMLLRSAAVVYTASCIPEESKTLKRILYSVPSAQYCGEIQRFLAQVYTDEIALTGLGLFSVTRSFILTMLGTIATYEILLVQMYRSSSE